MAVRQMSSSLRVWRLHTVCSLTPSGCLPLAGHARVGWAGRMLLCMFITCTVRRPTDPWFNAEVVRRVLEAREDVHRAQRDSLATTAAVQIFSIQQTLRPSLPPRV
eukprot:COSAG01_NODE_34372_length_548_cov_37.142539_1_plen_105_part_01